MFSGKIIEYKYNGTFVWMKKLPVSCDEHDATRKNIKPRSDTAINFCLLVRVRYTFITMMEMYPNLCQPGSTTTSAAA